MEKCQGKIWQEEIYKTFLYLYSSIGSPYIVLYYIRAAAQLAERTQSAYFLSLPSRPEELRRSHNWSISIALCIRTHCAKMDKSVKRSQLASSMVGRKPIKIFRYHFYGSYKVNYHFHNVLWTVEWILLNGTRTTFTVAAAPLSICVCVCVLNISAKSSQNARISLIMQIHSKTGSPNCVDDNGNDERGRRVRRRRHGHIMICIENMYLNEFYMIFANANVFINFRRP